MKTKLVSHLYTGQSLTVVHITNGELRTEMMQSTDANWVSVMKAFKAKHYNRLVELLSIRKTITIKSDGQFSVDGENVLYKGEVVGGFLFTKIIDNLREGVEFDNLLKFADNLWQNPSHRARTELYTFLANRNYTIDDDGYVVGWKGVQNDYWSQTGNLKTVVLRGKVDPITGKIFNAVGESIEVERASVDDDHRNTCSMGLHVGSRCFANSFRESDGRLMAVRFNPRDAIAVPSDENARKLRVCAYDVFAEERLSKDAVSLSKADDSYPILMGFPSVYDDYDEDLEDMADAPVKPSRPLKVNKGILRKSPKRPRRDAYGRFCGK